MKRFKDIHVPHPHISTIHMPHWANIAPVMRAEKLFRSRHFWSVVAIVLIAAFLILMAVWAALQGSGSEERIVTPFLYGP